MTTQLMHMENDQLVSCEAEFLGAGEDERGRYWFFDRTVFYPQGGGQATDQGEVLVQEESNGITFVATSEEGVRHYLEGRPVAPAPGTPVLLRVDPVRRRAQAAVHTAGHLVQSVLEALAPGWSAIKGYHFPDSPYVEFDGMPSGDRSALVEEANSRMASLIAENRKILRSQSTGPESLRLVTIEGFPPVPCAGTHLVSLGDLAEVTLRKIKPKRGNGRANYSCVLGPG